MKQVVENKDKYLVIVSIANHDDINKIEESLMELGISVTTVEQILLLENKKLDAIEKNRLYIADYHLDEMEDYYEDAETDDSMRVFWGNNSEFFKLFCLLDLDHVVELACGHGRHVPWYIDNANKIVLVDILGKNIEYCKSRFGYADKKIRYYVNNGYDLSELASSEYSSLFSYDAMVHFEMIDIFQYLKETNRILKSGGMALFHHSNNTEDYRITFSTGTSGRNYMSDQLFAYLANRAGLRVLEQKVIDWGVKNLDCLTLVTKD